MEKIKYLFLILFLVNCSSNDRAAVDYSVMNKPLYDYDVEEKIKQLNIELPTPGEPIANYVPTVRFSETKNSMLVYVSRWASHVCYIWNYTLLIKTSHYNIWTKKF